MVRPIMVESIVMKSVSMLLFLASVLIVFMSACANQGPSTVERANELQQQREAERQQAEFRKGLPPVTNPGRGE
jgi:hypothetical protein